MKINNIEQNELFYNNKSLIIDKSGIIEFRKNDRYHRENGPACIHISWRKQYYIDGFSHRDDGPAVIYDDGTILYHNHGRLHNDNGPAIKFPNGDEEFYSNGEKN